MKKPSPVTELRNLRRHVKNLHADYVRALEERNAFRGRLTKAEQETAEWKRRFDALLTRMPERVAEPKPTDPKETA